MGHAMVYRIWTIIPTCASSAGSVGGGGVGSEVGGSPSYSNVRSTRTLKCLDVMPYR